MAQGLLEDAGIPVYVLGQIATLVQSVDGLLRKWVRLQGAPRPRNRSPRASAQFHEPLPHTAGTEA